MGQDLNRAWADTNKFMHSEIVDIKKKLQHYDNHSAYDLGNFLRIYFAHSLVFHLLCIASRCLALALLSGAPGGYWGDARP